MHISIKSDVVIVKNYLSEEELYSLRRIVSAYLDLAESRAIRHIPMTMEDWSTRLDEFLKLTDREILQDAGKISHKIACDKQNLNLKNIGLFRIKYILAILISI